MDYSKNSLYDSKISLLCPTRKRMGDVKRFIRSVEGTVSKLSNVKIYFGVDHDDIDTLKTLETLSKIKSYVNLIKLPKYKQWPGLGTIWNYMVQQTSEDIIGMAGDDMVYETMGWDSKIKQHFIDGPNDRVLMVHCNDGIHGPGNTLPFPSIPVAVNSFIHRTHCNIIGHYTQKELKHQFLDTWLTDVYEKLNRRVYCHDIMIRHKHHSVTGNVDSVTKNLREHSNYEKCFNLYKDLEPVREKEIKKIKNYIDKHITLFNMFHNGDLFYSRDIIQNLIRRGYYITYFHKMPPGVFEDITNIREEMFATIHKNTLFRQNMRINKHPKYGYNTWVALHFDGSPYKTSVCNWVMKKAQRSIFKQHGIALEPDDEQTLPVVNFKNLNNKITKNIDNKLTPLCAKFKKTVLLSNGPANSGQHWDISDKDNRLLNESKIQNIYCELIKQTPQILYIITDKQDIEQKLRECNNVIYTDNITSGLRPDLLYISYISLKCNIIIGYPSGPYIYTQTEENLNDSNKHYICYCKKQVETLPHSEICSASHSHILTSRKFNLNETDILNYLKQII